MPIYEYQCRACGEPLEAMQKMNDPPLRKCPACGKSQLVRLISAPMFRLKGGGPHFLDSQVLAWSALDVGGEPRGHCPVFGVRCPPPLRRFHKEKYSIQNPYWPVWGSFRDSRSVP